MEDFAVKLGKWEREWLDENKLLHVHKQPSDSENPMLFSAIFYIAIYLRQKIFLPNHLYKAISSLQGKGWDWRDSPTHEFGGKFGLDNSTGLICLSKLFKLNYHKEIPIFHYHGGRHPKDVIFYGYAKYSELSKTKIKYLPLRILFTMLLPVTSFAMILSCVQTYKVKPYWYEKLIHFFKTGEWIDLKIKIVKTDGKILAWLRCQTFKMKWTYKICSFFIKRNKHFGSWKKVFEIYYPEGHPNRDLVFERIEDALDR